MSDISKKIFSIDPEPDEAPIAHVPPLPVDTDDIDDTSPAIADTQKRAPLQLRPVDELTDRDIVSAIRSSGPIAEMDAPIAAGDAQLAEQAPEVVNTEAVIRRAVADIEPGPSPSLVAAVAPRQPITPRSDTLSEPATEGSSFGWIGFLLTILTAVMVSAILYVFFGGGRTLTPVDMTALALAVIVPSATVGTLWAAVRTLSRVKARSDHLALTAARLIHVDDAVTQDVAHMASAIRTELTGVDQHLDHTRQHLLSVTEQAAVQGAELASMTKTAAGNADAIEQALSSQREQFRTLLSDFEIRLQTLAQSVERHTNLLESTGANSASKIETVTQTMGATLDGVSERGQALSDHVETADHALMAAEERLSAMAERIGERISELDGVYARRAQHLSDLSDRMDAEASQTEQALTRQSEQLSAIDAQIETTEQRLTALLDHARGIQSQLSSRLSDIDSTLSDADRRSREFTADMSDRINDSVSQTRRELSVMESELRVLQTRMKALPDPELGLSAPLDTDRRPAPNRIHLQPLDSDFPPVEPQPLDIPDEPDESLLDLVEVVDVPLSDSARQDREMRDDVIRRPGLLPTARKGFGRSRRDATDSSDKSSGWHWRDMLGAIDPVDEPAIEDSAHTAPATQSGIDRPPPGVPLSPPGTVMDTPADGSDVVARLCEVQLAPSAVVDEGTIYEAAAVRRTGGEDAQNACVQARLDGPIMHLRRVLEDDLEFKLRAESFRRSYAETVATIHSDDALQAKLGSATGRAYLLCAAALRSL
ncbi:MAG: hypothetical protein AAF926_03145 [Pseudomonadota bacterium]